MERNEEEYNKGNEKERKWENSELLINNWNCEFEMERRICGLKIWNWGDDDGEKNGNGRVGSRSVDNREGEDRIEFWK